MMKRRMRRLQVADKEKEEDKTLTVVLGKWTPSPGSWPLTIVKEIKDMFLRLDFSQTVAQKLADDQGKNVPCTLASVSDKNINAICDVIRRLVSSETMDTGNQISILAAKSIKLSLLKFKWMEIAPWPMAFGISKAHLQ